MIHMTLDIDTEPREVTVPDDLQQALDANPEAKARFEKYSYSHQKAYVDAVVEAKKPETRTRRIQQTVEMLIAGKTR
jgi:uncharacterized protein YdeI (YjbR/CyaY-like superfamily)